MKCPECGAENPETSEFCGLCFNRFKEDLSPEVARHIPPLPVSDVALSSSADDAGKTEEPAAGTVEPGEAIAAGGAAGVDAGAAAKVGEQPGEPVRKPAAELPSEAALPQYWEKTFEALRQQSKTPSNTRKITIVAVAALLILTALIVSAMVLLQNAKRNQGGTDNSVESQPSRRAPATSPGTLALTAIREIGSDGSKKLFEVSGDGFQVNAVVSLQSGGKALQATDVVVYTSTRLECKIDPGQATAGSWTLILRNPDGKSVSLPDAIRMSR